MKSPAFQFYVADWLGSQRVQMMSLEEEGAYIRLLCSCWQHGSIPADPLLAARLIGKGASTTLATVVQAMFQPGTEPGRLVHDRLELEKSKQAAWRAKSVEGGLKSAEKRKGGRKGGSRVVQPPHQPNGNSSSSSSSSSSVSGLRSASSAPTLGEESPKPSQTAFAQFWEEYPRKKAKSEAEKAWSKASLPSIEIVIAAIKDQRSTDDWTKEGGRYIPHPATWINQKRWEDEVAPNGRHPAPSQKPTINPAWRPPDDRWLARILQLSPLFQSQIDDGSLTWEGLRDHEREYVLIAFPEYHKSAYVSAK